MPGSKRPAVARPSGQYANVASTNYAPDVKSALKKGLSRNGTRVVHFPLTRQRQKRKCVATFHIDHEDAPSEKGDSCGLFNVDRVTPTTTELSAAAAATTTCSFGAPPQTTIRHRRPPPDDRVAGAGPAAPSHLCRPPTQSAQYGWRVRRPSPRIRNSVLPPRESWRAPAGPTPLRAPKAPARPRTPRSLASPPHRLYRQTRRPAQRPPARLRAHGLAPSRRRTLPTTGARSSMSGSAAPCTSWYTT